MAAVVFESVTRTYAGSTMAAVDRLSLEAQNGELLVLVGPSGCGKSTTLRMLAGLEDVDSGRITLGGRDITRTPARLRDIAMVFQNYALYPNMTVAENMSFALRMAGSPRAAIKERVERTSTLLGLDPYSDRLPRTLSGGQRQRVAMGRAIVRQPQAFLMDEPLSNLDAQLRVRTRVQIHTLQRELGTTMVYVTHDQVEAMTLGDRVAVMDGGRLSQVGTPLDLYARPANTFVARFIGSPAMNLIEAPLTADGVMVADTAVPLPRAGIDAAAAQGLASLMVGFRPEDVSLRASDDPGILFDITLVELVGADAFVHGALTAVPDQPIVARCAADVAPAVGSRVRAVPDLDRLHLFSPASGARL